MGKRNHNRSEAEMAKGKWTLILGGREISIPNVSTSNLPV